MEWRRWVRREEKSFCFKRKRSLSIKSAFGREEGERGREEKDWVYEMRRGVCVRIVVVKGLNFIDFEFEKFNSLTKSITRFLSFQVFVFPLFAASVNN